MTGSRRVVLLAAVGAALLAAVGCCSGGATRTTTGASAVGDLSKACLLDDVQLIVVKSDGSTIPKQAKVRKGIQVVVWVADADALALTFPSSGNGNPFPNQPQCDGRFCYSIQTPNGDAGKVYDYDGTITRGGQSKKIDPRIEIMN